MKTKKKTKNKKKNNTGLLSQIDFNKIWSLVFLFTLGWIFSICLLDANYTLKPVTVIVVMIVYVVVLTLLYKFLSKKFSNMSNKSAWIFYAIITVIMLALQGVIGYFLRVDAGYDLGNVIESAKEILEYGHSTDMAGYYIQAPNNIFITLLLALTIKIFSFIGITESSVSTLIVNIIFIQLAILFLFKLAKNIYGNFTGCFVLILSLLFLPFYPYSTLMYTDTTSMFLPVLFLYLIYKIHNTNERKKVIIYSVVTGLFAFVAFNLKVTALIVLIAFIFNELINRRFKKLLLILSVIIISFLAIHVSYTAVIKKTGVIGIDYKSTKEIPFTHFIMMGMYKTGAFDSGEWQYTFSLPDHDTRQQEHIRIIKERLKNYGQQGYIKFLNNKVKGQTWGTGTYDFEWNIDTFPVERNEVHEYFMADGKYWNNTYYYCQFYHFTMIFLILISILSSIIKSDKKEILNISRLSLFGILLFLLMWETRSRYLINFIPVFILVMTSGIIFLADNSNKVKEILFLKNNN